MGTQRDLRRGGHEFAGWQESDGEARAPRLGPREYIGTGVTRVGRFRTVDPLRTGRLWNRTEWTAFGLWVGGTVATLLLAKRRVDRERSHDEE